MKYLKKFDTETDMNSYLNGEDIILPNVSMVYNTENVVFKSLSNTPDEPTIETGQFMCYYAQKHPMSGAIIAEYTFTFVWSSDKPTWADYVGATDIDNSVIFGSSPTPPQSGGYETPSIGSIDTHTGVLGSISIFMPTCPKMTDIVENGKTYEFTY